MGTGVDLDAAERVYVNEDLFEGSVISDSKLLAE